MIKIEQAKNFYISTTKNALLHSDAEPISFCDRYMRLDPKVFLKDYIAFKNFMAIAILFNNSTREIID